MNTNDFTNWLKGYLEGINGTPTAEQLEVIKSKLNITYAYFQPYYAPYYNTGYYGTTCGATALTTSNYIQ